MVECKKVRRSAHAKINIILDIKGRYPNGYHILDMIMLSLELHDTVILKKTDEDVILISTNGGAYSEDRDNLVYKAISAVKERFGIKEGVMAEIEKVIPISAGLAGGSSDCAAALRGMAELFGLDIAEKELYEIGGRLGADVPFCLYRNPARAEGIGEILTEVPDFPPCVVLLAKPAVGISTPDAFREYDRRKNIIHPDMDKMLMYMKKGDIKDICSSMGNVLEGIAIEKYAVIGDIKKEMMDSGAEGALMSGSGSAVFGIYKDKNTVLSAYEIIKEKFGIDDIFITEILGKNSGQN